MKVLHISTSIEGGAGTAALRLHKGLIKEGINSNFLALHGESQLVPKIVTLGTEECNLLGRISRKILSKINAHRNARRLAGKDGRYEAFTFPTTDYDISQHPMVKEADVINLHWVSNFFDFPRFFKKVKKPIVWTLHDMNPFMGGFHYEGDETRNYSTFKKLEEELKEQKSLLYQQSTIKKIVSPSFWLRNASSVSNLMRKFDHIRIPYGLDTDIFHPYNSSFAREVFQLPKGKIILLFVAESISKYRKGFDLLLNHIRSLPSTGSYVLVAIGNVPDNKIKDVIYLGSIKDERLMALAYSAADAFLLPSREDNLPNVMLESLACGTPVIGTPVGGMKEVIKDGWNGYLSKDITAESFQNGIEKFIQNSQMFDREKIHKEAERQFSLAVQAQEYIRVYMDILGKDQCQY